MRSYLSAGDKEIFISVSAIFGTLDLMSKSDVLYRGEKLPKDKVQEAAVLIQSLLEQMEDGLDQECLIGIKRKSKGLRWELQGECDPRLNKEWYYASEEDADAFIRDPLSRCICCDLNREEAHRCQIRKALLHMAISPANPDDSVCPFRSDL